MKLSRLFAAIVMATWMAATPVSADSSATVTEAVNDVSHGSKNSGKSPAHVGTAVFDGQYLETGMQSRAEIRLPTASITRLGANTSFNYSVGSNTVDLREGVILFCKPKNSTTTLRVETAAVTAGITGTTGFMSVTGSGKKKTYVFGIIEGHAVASADGKPFLVTTGEIIEFRPGMQPFKFAFDVPRFVKSSPLLHKYKSTLPNQSAIDHAVAEYNDDLSRGFITKPKGSIDYSGDIPVLANVAFDSAQNAKGRPTAQPTAPPPPPPPSGTYSPSSFGP